MSITILKVTSRCSYLSSPFDTIVTDHPIAGKSSKLPATIEVTPTTTVQDVKEQIGKAARKDPNCIGVSDPVKKKILKDRKALILEQKDVADLKEVVIKDLGQ
jgi:hypothetical protein